MRRWLIAAASISLLCSALTAADGEAPSVVSVPPILASPSCIGEVIFPHEMHFEDIGIPCEDCHHEVNATKLDMPHSNYFDDFWIDCLACHGESGRPSTSQSCSTCHHSDPTGIADETLSSKVVIHKSCWQCHEMGTGNEASSACPTCHQGARTSP